MGDGGSGVGEGGAGNWKLETGNWKRGAFKLSGGQGAPCPYRGHSPISAPPISDPRSPTLDLRPSIPDLRSPTFDPRPPINYIFLMILWAKLSRSTATVSPF